ASRLGSASNGREKLTFDDFQADLRTRELFHQGTRVRLPDQSFQVLAMLLEHPGELVSREDIRKQLWPEDTFVDFDHGLNNAVNPLREALEDSAAQPRFVETLPRRGYRFIGTLNSPPSLEVVPQPIPVKPPTPRPQPSRKWRRLQLWLLGAIAL